MRNLLSVLAILPAVLVVAFFTRGGRQGLPLEFLADEEIRAMDLEAARVRLFRQIDEADAVAAQLANGGISLEEAVREMERLNQDRPGFSNFFEPHRLNLPEGASWREQLAGYAIRKVVSRLETTGRVDGKAVLARLRWEFAILYGYPIET
jgi:hypothetical protein